MKGKSVRNINEMMIRIILLTIAIFACLYPMWWLLTVSLKTEREAFRTPPSLIFRPIFAHYRNLFLQANFFKYFSNSALISLGSAAIALIIGTLAAYVISQSKFRHKNKFLFMILVSRMAPPVIFIIPYFIIYSRLGLIDTHIGLIVVYLGFNLSLVIWSMVPFFDNLPRELTDAASIDGASDFQVFSKVMLPLVSPGLGSTAVLALILAWNEFFFAMVLTRDRAITAPVAVVQFASYEAADWGMVAAGSILLTLPIFFLSFLVHKHLVRGLATGALKE